MEWADNRLSQLRNHIENGQWFWFYDVNLFSCWNLDKCFQNTNLFGGKIVINFVIKSYTFYLFLPMPLGS